MSSRRPPGAPRAGLVLALVALAVAGCGKKPPAGGGALPGQSHATPGAAPALSAEEAEAELVRALADGADREAVLYANRLEAAGGELGRRGARVREAIDRLPEEELLEVWRELEPEARPAPAVALRLALLYRHRGDGEGALTWARRVPEGAADRERAEALLAEIESARLVDPAVVAVLLPLSGRYSSIGGEIRAAVEMAASETDEVKVRFLDTAGDPEVATRAVERAVHREKAVALLGPVGGAVSRAAARRAVELGVPIGVLAPAQAGAAPAAGVFRLSPSEAWEARQAALLAVELGYDRLAVFAPRDEVGRVQSEAFGEAARSAGVRVVASELYDPTATDLEPDVKRLLGLDPAENERLRRHLRRYGRKKGWKTYSPDVAFDLLYVPDSYERAALVASYLPYFNVEVRTSELMDTLRLRKKHGGRLPSIVQLLGSSGWHDPSLIPRGGEAVEGALVLDVYSGGPKDEYPSDLAAEFASRFRGATGREPSSVAAQAYDAAALLFAARRGASPARARDPREAVRKALRGARLSEGVCGSAAITKRGQLVREVLVLRVERGEFVFHQY